MQPAHALNAAAALLACCAIGCAWRCRGSLTGTTLTHAWRWSMAALTSALAVNVAAPFVAEGLADQLWWLSAATALCPAVAVLGARRPVAGVWSWFVLCPLVCVFMLPTIPAWRTGFPPDPPAVETPILLGWLLVATMGFGNFAGTRYALHAAAIAGSLTAIVATLSAAAPLAFSENAGIIRPLAALVAVAAMIHVCLMRSPSAVDDEPDGTARGWPRVWREFHHRYGLVWTRRVAERVNRECLERQLPLRLETAGLIWQTDDVAARTDAWQAIEPTLRHLLRRFVDDAWIDERLRG